MQTLTVEERPVLAQKLKTKCKELSTKREIERARADLAIKAKEVSWMNRLDKAEKEIAHRELFENELREAIKLAAERRVDASYRELIDSVDKMKKQLNIIDGVGQEQVSQVVIIPSELLKRDAPDKYIEATAEIKDADNK